MLQKGLKLWQRGLKGVWVVGHLTYPREPTITARIEGRSVLGTFKKGGLFRRGRHLYITAHAHEDRALLGGPVVEKYASGSGRFKLELRSEVESCVVHATAYNRLRQTSRTATLPDVRAG
jgi:hypothetical protein